MSSTDHDLIEVGITDANNARRSIDDLTTRIIATQLYSHFGSALYALASTGAVEIENLNRELDDLERQSTSDDEIPPSWVAALRRYVQSLRNDRGPVDHWSSLTW